METGKTAKTDKLKQAVQAEKAAIVASKALYKRMTNKITRFQLGKGSAPTEDEFKQWIAEVEKAVELKRALGGVSGA